jgi:hypothetical protein
MARQTINFYNAVQQPNKNNCANTDHSTKYKPRKEYSKEMDDTVIHRKNRKIPNRYRAAKFFFGARHDNDLLVLALHYVKRFS